MSIQALNAKEKGDTLDINEDISDVVRALEQARNEIFKWMFIFWIGQFAATAGILFAFLNVYFKK